MASAAMWHPEQDSFGAADVNDKSNKLSPALIAAFITYTSVQRSAMYLRNERTTLSEPSSLPS